MAADEHRGSALRQRRRTNHGPPENRALVTVLSKHPGRDEGKAGYLPEHRPINIPAINILSALCAVVELSTSIPFSHGKPVTFIDRVPFVTFGELRNWG
jgi:hypothetical protein